MKLLFLTPQLPYPPRQGAALRNWGFISQLAERNHVAVLSFLAPGQKAIEDDRLPVDCQIETVPVPMRSLGDRLRALLVTRRADMALRLASGPYARRLEEWLARDAFDIVHVGGLEMAPYLGVLEAARRRPGILFDDLNCEYLLQKRAFITDLRSPRRWLGAAYSWVQYRRLRRYEARICRRADGVIAVSETDAAALRQLTPGVDITVIPNGIDTRMYHPKLSDVSLALPQHSLVFTGTMDFRPNVDAVLWFVRRVLPLIQNEIPDVRLFVVGQRPHRRLEGVRDDPALTLTGWVEDTRPYIGQGAVYVAPLRIGGGTRLKLLEAMAMGKPVVATTLGAEGYPVTHGRELLLADTPVDFAAAVVDLLRCPKRRAELGSVGRAFVEQRYDWRAIVPRLEKVYASLE